MAQGLGSGLHAKVQAERVEASSVISQVDRLVEHPLFRGSRRYPVLLRYLVDRTLSGHAEELKERTIGVEVFGRLPEYDTAADHIVRSTVSEMRRRLAEYYADPVHAGELRIEIPPGAYLPVFSNGTSARSGVGHPHASLAAGNGFLHRHRIAAATALAVLALGVAFGVWGVPQIRRDPVALFWDPVLEASPEITICAGAMYPQDRPLSERTTATEESEPGVTVTFAAGMARMTRFLQSRGTTGVIVDANETTLAGLAARNFVLTGAFNNPWTLELTGPTRFHFVQGSAGGQNCIEDRWNPTAKEFCAPAGVAAAQVAGDFGLVARFSEPKTKRTAVVLAGLYRYGVSAAGALVRDPQYARLLDRSAQRGWEHKNIEAVVATEVTRGTAGPPRVVAVYTW